MLRSRAPVRISFAGGGTDMPPYCLEHGGCVISTTIDKYIYVTAEFNDSKIIKIFAYDLGKNTEITVGEYDYNGKGDFDIFKAILNDFSISCGCNIYVHSDLPAKSGMGTSSSLTVALIALFTEYKKLKSDKYKIAEIACDIERKKLNQTGGYQDQYAASLGGFNFIEFGTKIIAHPLKMNKFFLEELNYRLILIYTGKTHISSEIQDQVLSNYGNVNFNQGMKELKDIALKIYAIFKEQDISRLQEYGTLQHKAWIAKKKLSDKISNPDIEKLYTYARYNGALGGKILGAGGAGYLLLAIDPLKKVSLINKLRQIGGKILQFRFESTGVMAWEV